MLLPYIDIGEEGTSPAEAENFDLLAKEQYEAKYPKKKYDDLSYEYRRKLWYKAIEDYHKAHGENSSYKQIPSGSTFSDYFAGQSDKFQQEWLGKKRYEMYKSGKLPIEWLHDPDKGFKRTIQDLEKELAKDHGEAADILPMSPLVAQPTDFDKLLTSIKDHLDLKDIVLSPEMEQILMKHGMTSIDVFADKVNQFIKENKVVVNIDLAGTAKKPHPLGILTFLADEPVLKNQFETKTSGGTLDSGRRNAWESVIAGHKINQHTTKAKYRPCYGYINNVGEKEMGFYVAHYGETMVVLKDSVRERTTFTIGDSSAKQGAFMNDARAIFNKDRPDPAKARLYNEISMPEAMKAILRGKEDSCRKLGLKSDWYIEAQVWGRADLRKDVEEIAIGAEDLKVIANDVKLLQDWQRLKKQMDVVNVRLTHYVDWTDDKIHDNPVKWNELHVDVAKLGIKLINIAK
jgi:hypothetical protein